MLPTNQLSTSETQPGLFDHGQHARETQAIAAIPATAKRASRQDRIEDFVRSKGDRGALRHEIADAMGWPLSGVCSPVLAMLRSERLIENGEKRLTQFGSMAAVLVLHPSQVEG